MLEVEVVEADRDTAGEAFDGCAAKAQTCPTGQLAIVVDGVVISAPVVNGTGLAEQRFIVTGGPPGFTQAEAEDLAEQIDL